MKIMGPAEYNVRAFGAVGDGLTDDSDAFQAAIDKAHQAGGGTVVVPGSNSGYALRRPILVRADVTLKGFHVGPTDSHLLSQNDANQGLKAPEPLKPVPGAILVKQSKYPAITLAQNSGIAGLAFVYPDQVPYSASQIKPYPPLLQVRGVERGEQVPGIARTESIKEDGPISGRSVSIRDIGAINAYHILDIAGEYPTKYQVAQITVDGLWGYPLSVGVSIENSLDTIILHNIQFRPTFFGGACSQISKESIGFALGKSDGCAISDVLVFGLGIGILHRCREKSYGAFSVRVSNANIEAMMPVWFDSKAVDDQVQYTNSFLFHTSFAFAPKPGDVYTRKGHALFPDISYGPDDLCVVRVSNRCDRQTFQSYARFVGCGFHAKSAGPICRVEGTQPVRVMMSSSNMVYFRDAVLKAAKGAKPIAVMTGNDIMAHSTNLAQGAPEATGVHLIDFTQADPSARAVFSDNMIHGVRQSLVDELVLPQVTAQGNMVF